MAENRDNRRAGRRRRSGAARRRLWRRRAWGGLRNRLLAGLLVSSPLVATAWLIWQGVTFVDSGVKPLLPDQFEPSTYLPFDIPGVGLLAAITALTLVGALAASFAGRTLARIGDWIFLRVPLIRGIYSWTKQVFEAVLAHRSTAFRQVVLIEYPRPGIWAVGFVTGRTEGEVQALTSETVVNVFLPATPNVTTGFLLFVPEEDVRPLDLSVEEGLKLIVSGGIVGGSGGPVPLPSPRANPRGLVARGLTRLRQYFFAGLVAAAPIGMTLWIAWALVTFVDRLVARSLPDEWTWILDLPYVLPGVGVLVLVLALLAVGTFATGFVGRSVIRGVESLLARMPVVRNIYTAFKHLFETVLSRQAHAFRQVVLFEYPRRHCWAMGFATGRNRRLVDANRGGETIHVFLPTTPNPTSGFLLLIPEAEVRVLSMSVEQGIKMVVSGGLVTPHRATETGTVAASPA